MDNGSKKRHPANKLFRRQSVSNQNKKLKFWGTNAFAALPLLLFAVFCVLFFVVFKVFEMDALAMGGFVSIILCSLLAKKKKNYWDAVVKGMANPMVNMLALILLVVSFFTKMMAKGGVAQGFVWIGSLLGLHGGTFVAFAFIVTSIITTSTGTSIGTLFSVFPILYPSGILLGANPAILAGAILSGSIFGDNVGPISDTTIASCSTQNYRSMSGTADIGGAVKSRLKYALIAGAIALILYFILGSSGSGKMAGDEILKKYTNPKGLLMLIPVVVLLTIAVKKRNIFIAITWGVISGIIIGLVSGIMTPSDIISVKNGSLEGFCYNGIKSILGTVGYLYGIAGMMGILTESGVLENLIQVLLHSKMAQTDKGAEFIIAIGIMLSSICLGAANGPAIIMFGPVADEIGSAKRLHPYRRANLLDGFAGTIPVILPFVSAFIFIVITVISGLQEEYTFIQMINPITLAFCTFHCIALFFVFLFSVITGWGRRYEGDKGIELKTLES